jgi:hypothetical protein
VKSGSLAGKYIINTRDFPRPTKVIVAEKVLNVAINTNKVTQITVSGQGEHWSVIPCSWFGTLSDRS